MIKRLVLIITMTLCPVIASAQMSTPEVAGISAEWQAVALATQHLQEKLTAYIGKSFERDAQLKNLQEYAVRCGDKPGCFLPVPKD